MARQLKPQQVGEVTHKNVTIPILLNRNTKMFFAEYGGERVEQPAFEAVQHLAIALIERALCFDWQPVIQISLPQGFHHDEHPDVGLRVKRFYVASHPQEGYMQAAWEREGHERSDTREERAHRFWWHGEGPFQLPCVSRPKYSRKIEGYYLPYREETWQGLLEIEAALVTLRDHLLALLGTAEGQQRIAEAGARALAGVLPAPEIKEVEGEQQQ